MKEGQRLTANGSGSPSRCAAFAEQPQGHFTIGGPVLYADPAPSVVMPCVVSYIRRIGVRSCSRGGNCRKLSISPRSALSGSRPGRAKQPPKSIWRASGRLLRPARRQKPLPESRSIHERPFTRAHLAMPRESPAGAGLFRPGPNTPPTHSRPEPYHAGNVWTTATQVPRYLARSRGLSRRDRRKHDIKLHP